MPAVSARVWISKTEASTPLRYTDGLQTEMETEMKTERNSETERRERETGRERSNERERESKEANFEMGLAASA